MYGGGRPDRAPMRRALAVVRELDRTVGIPRPFDLDVLVADLTRVRERPIELLPLGLDQLAAGVCGLWLDLPDRDVVVFPAPATPNHRDHIALHEIGHMLAGHRGRGGSSGLALLTPDLDPAMVRTVLARSAYHRREEREAELISSLVLARSLGDGPSRAADPAEDPTTDRAATGRAATDRAATDRSADGRAGGRAEPSNDEHGVVSRMEHAFGWESPGPR